VITALHALVYADDPEAARAFFRDVLCWPHVDAGGGWLIFRTGPSEVGVHPTSGFGDDAPPIPEHHEISLVCDDLRATLAELEARGAEFSRGVEEQGFGLTAVLTVPGAGNILLYQPRHEVAHGL
jgi:predicted enzyme related to lactoylglutathione lyase